MADLKQKSEDINVTKLSNITPPQNRSRYSEDVDAVLEEDEMVGNTVVILDDNMIDLEKPLGEDFMNEIAADRKAFIKKDSIESD